MIISFLNQKGGVGKTTSVFNFASCLALKDKKNVLVVDTDPQQSLFNFLCKKTEITGKPKFDFIANTRLTEKKVLEGHDYVLIDTPGFDNKNVHKIIEITDKIVIPVKPNILDMESLDHTLNIIFQHHLRGFKPKSFVYFNMVNKKKGESNEILKTQIIEHIDNLHKEYKILEKNPINVLETDIVHSIIFEDSMTERQSIFEHRSSRKRVALLRDFEKIVNGVIND